MYAVLVWLRCMYSVSNRSYTLASKSVSTMTKCCGRLLSPAAAVDRRQSTATLSQCRWLRCQCGRDFTL